MTVILGVYLIRCDINNRVYVGSSNDVYRRWNDHQSDLRAGRHKSSKLQADYTRYGARHFQHSILCTADNPEQVRDLEQQWLNELDAVNSGYNHHVSTKGGAGSKQSKEAKTNQIAAQLGRKVSQETRDKISKTKKGQAGRPMSQSNLKALQSPEAMAKKNWIIQAIQSA